MTDDNTAAPESASDQDRPPPLPPRPGSSAIPPPGSSRGLQARPTTAVSSLDIQTLQFPDGSRGTFSTPAPRVASGPGISSGYDTPTRSIGGPNNDHDDVRSILSLAPTMQPPGDIASLMMGGFNRKSPAWNLLRAQAPTVQPFESAILDTSNSLVAFKSEFDEIPAESDDASNDDDRLRLWRSKLKHYMILSSAGKPIYSRHGDLGLVNSYMGVVQTIISFYEGAQNPLAGFTAGDTRFVVATEGPLYLIAISRLGESDAQIRGQLEALYLQILSTLTLPTLTNIFAHRPSTDLRKPLQGTEALLSSLADNFTRGSPSALLGALECLKLRKTHRHSITNTFLKLRTEKLVYGLIVAGGRLVSVIRPRRHSLHPSDLQLIFNMLFESGSVKAGGGERWIPVCLPTFNNKGYLYMYVDFFEPSQGTSSGMTESTPPTTNADRDTDDVIAIILISADKESFFELKQMRDAVASQLTKNGSMAIMQAATRLGRPKVTDIAPGGQISHFLYKSRANVQFSMASFAPFFTDSLARRRLMTLYHQLHASVHAKHCHLKVLHCVSHDATSLAWVTPAFEFYCVAGPNLSRTSMTQGANKIIQWAEREEERLFIIGGGVF